jgi:hypothetical protein
MCLEVFFLIPSPMSRYRERPLELISALAIGLSRFYGMKNTPQLAPLSSYGAEVESGACCACSWVLCSVIPRGKPRGCSFKPDDVLQHIRELKSLKISSRALKGRGIPSFFFGNFSIHAMDTEFFRGFELISVERAPYRGHIDISHSASLHVNG